MIKLIPIVFLFAIPVLFLPDLAAQEEKERNNELSASDPPDTKDKLAGGKMLYSKHCESCHGKSGRGDGSRAADLDISHGDLTKKEFKEKGKDEIMNKVFHGCNEMPSFERKIPEKDVELIIEYILTFQNDKEKKKQILTKKVVENEIH